MKCKQCGKTVRSISHWARMHKKWLASRPKHRKKAPTIPRTKAFHRGRKREVHLSEQAAVGIFAGNPAPHYCPLCGRRCG